MEGLYKKISGTFLYKIFGLGLAFVFEIILGRTLNPVLYGQYAMVLTYTNVLSIFAIFGMDKNLIKEVARVADDKLKVKSLFKFSLQISGAIFILLALIILFFHEEIITTPRELIYFLLIIFLLKVIIAILDGLLQGLGFIVKVTKLNILINTVLKIIIFFLLFFMNVNGIKAALLSFIISEILTICFRIKIILSLWGSKNSSKIVLKKSEKKNFLRYSLTVGLIAGIGILLQNIDKIMISNLLNLESVGIYRVAQNYVTLIGVFITPFIAFWPIISKLFAENRLEEIDFQMKKIVKLISFLVIPMFSIFLFINEEFLSVFGNAFVTNEGKYILIILAFAYLFDAISGPIGSILTMTKYARFVLMNNTLALLLNLVLNYYFIREFGVIGAAYGTGICIIVNNLLAIIEVKVLLGIFSYDKTNILQIISLSIYNYLICKYLRPIIVIENNLLFIIIFVTAVYIANILLLIILYRKQINAILQKLTKR